MVCVYARYWVGIYVLNYVVLVIDLSATDSDVMSTMVYLEKENVVVMPKYGHGPYLSRVPSDYGKMGIGELSGTSS